MTLKEKTGGVHTVRSSAKVLRAVSAVAVVLLAVCLAFAMPVSAENWKDKIDSDWYSSNGGDTSHTFKIYDGADLAAFANIVNTKQDNFTGDTIELMNNIDLQKIQWTPISYFDDHGYETPAVKFNGTFDGKDYTISNLVITGRTSEYHPAGLFGNPLGTIKNLKINCATVEYSIVGNNAGITVMGIGVVAGSTYNGTGTKGCTIENVYVTNADIKANRYAGGIVGYSAGDVINCHVENIRINVEPDLHTGSYDNGDKAGGIVGATYATFSNGGSAKISEYSAKNIEITAYRDVGGIGGLLQGGWAESDNFVYTATITLVQSTSTCGEKTANAQPIIGRPETGSTVDTNQIYSHVNIKVTFDGEIKRDDKDLGQEYTITIQQADNGVVTTTPSQNIQAGDQITINLNPNEGYHLETVSAETESGEQVSITDNTFFEMPAANVELTAVFVESPVIPDDNNDKPAGSSVWLTGPAYSIYSAHIENGGSAYFSDNSPISKITMPDTYSGDVTITTHSDAESPAGKNVYLKMEIDAEPAIPFGETATIHFKLPLFLLQQNGLEAADVCLYHLGNGWEKFPTQYSIVGDIVYYEAQTESFSPFAIVFEENAATEKDVQLTPAPATTETPASPAFGALSILAGLGAVLALRKP